MSWRITTIAAVVTAVALRSVLRRVRHVQVSGGSMRPALWPGDRLVVLVVPARPRPGHLVLCPDPRTRRRRLIKRVHAVGDGWVDVRGDDPSASTDSRSFGAVPADEVDVVVGFRYHPTERAGPVGARFVSGSRARAAPRGRRRPARR